MTGGGARRFVWRAWVRAIHRDLGYLAVGLTFVYALSGMAVNHVADWDPNFRNTEATYEVGPLPGADDVVAGAVLAKLAISAKPKRDVPRRRRAGDPLRQRTLHVDTETGHVVDEEQKPRFLIRVANWLHLNRGKKAWTYVADAYAVGLLVLATSGLFMIPGRKGLFGRGVVFLAVGVALPIAYLVLAGGPK